MTNREWLNSLDNIAFWNAIGCSCQVCNFFLSEYNCEYGTDDCKNGILKWLKEEHKDDK